MRKKGFLILAASALLTVGSAFVSWAAEGWVQSGSTWVYYDSYGYKVTNEWRKGADNQWRYLGSNGEMAVNCWVDNTYYLDSSGRMVTNQWLKVSSQDGYGGYEWYYFGDSGKAVMDTWSKIDNKWYYFDADGIMQTGWVDDDMYYCGEDGVMKTGWQKLYPPDEEYDPDDISPGDEYDDGKYWYYFRDSGKKYVPSDINGDYGTYKIDGVSYCFDETGALQTGWKNIGIDNPEYEIENYKYYDSNGRLRTGWYSIEPPEELNGYENNVEWFYFSSNGTPKTGPAEGEASTQDLTKINGKTYLFNNLGNPVYGLQKIRIGSTTEYTAYYFGDQQTSTMQTGKIRITEGDGSEATYYFSNSGRGYTGVKDGSLYYMGKLQRADSDMRYQAITIPAGNSQTTYVVNSSGKVAKSKTVKDADGVEYKTNGSGVLEEVNDQPASGTYTPPTEPVWE